MIVFQLAAVLFCLFMLYLTFLYRRRAIFSSLDSYVWSGIWGVALLLSLIPQAVFGSTPLGIPGTDLLAFIAVALMVAVSFFNSRDIKRSQRKLEDLVRNLALQQRKR